MCIPRSPSRKETEGKDITDQCIKFENKIQSLWVTRKHTLWEWEMASVQISSCYKDVILTLFPLCSNHLLTVAHRWYGLRTLFVYRVNLPSLKSVWSLQQALLSQYRLARYSANEIGHTSKKTLLCWYQVLLYHW